MVGMLNFWVFNDGNAVTFHTASDLYPGFVKIDAGVRVRNTSAGEEPDGFVANEFASGAENVTVYKKSSVCNMYFDADASVGQKVATGNRGMARGVDGFTSGQNYGVVRKTYGTVSGSTAQVWVDLD